ncbi:MAG: hypothetical protein EXS19_05550, partial [Pedosphaera sp.]|nr:hypothetical protein [Pedosphaera sp.]
ILLQQGKHEIAQKIMERFDSSDLLAMAPVWGDKVRALNEKIADKLSSSLLVIADKGASDYQIVLPDTYPTPPIGADMQQVARLLQTAFKANGAELAVVTETARDKTKPAIYLGATAFARSHGVDCKGWSYVHKAVGRDLIVAGRDEPAPAVVALHSHGGYYRWGREREVATSDAIHPTLKQMREVGAGGKAYGIEMVRRGYIVICIDMFYWGERRVVLDDDLPEWKARSLTFSDEQLKAYHDRCNRDEEIIAKTLYCAGVSWAGIIAWDDIRTVDYLITRPDVDPNRIACVGSSVGGLRSSYLAALDNRIKAAVVSSWMCSFPNQLAAHIRGIGFTKIIPGIYHHMDHPDIASLAMPKPLMVINGSQDRLFEVAGVDASHKRSPSATPKPACPSASRASSKTPRTNSTPSARRMRGRALRSGFNRFQK